MSGPQLPSTYYPIGYFSQQSSLSKVYHLLLCLVVYGLFVHVHLLLK